MSGGLGHAGFRSMMEFTCSPQSDRCPEEAAQLSQDDAHLAARGQLFVVDMGMSPCSAVGGDGKLAQMMPTVELPWPLPPGHYALCYCSEGVGCPVDADADSVTMHYIGELRVLGSIRSVALSSAVGIATIPLEVEVAQATAGIQCCGRTATGHTGTSLDLCSDVIARDPGDMLPAPSAYLMQLVLPGPRLPNEVSRVSVSCRAYQEDEAHCGEEGSECTMPPGGLEVVLAAPPSTTWSRVAVGSELDIDAVTAAMFPATEMAGGSTRGDLRMWLKVVSREQLLLSSCSGESHAGVVSGLPCWGTGSGVFPQKCAFAATPLIASAPGRYGLCLCEEQAILYGQVCTGWHLLGDLLIFGPYPFDKIVKGTIRSPVTLRFQGVGLTGDDFIFTVPGLASNLCDAVLAIESARDLPSNHTVHSIKSWAESLLVVEAVLTEGVHSICWAPPKSQGRPLHIGLANVSIDEIDCLVSSWTAASDCDAVCGSGLQAWRRHVVTDPTPNGGACPALYELRVCQGPPCAQIATWGITPRRPQIGAPVQLRVAGVALPSNVQALLVLQPDREPSTSAPPACKPRLDDQRHEEISHSSTCTGSEHVQTCIFNASELSVAGQYAVCLCMVSNSTCIGWWPMLGTTQVGHCAGCAFDEHTTVEDASSVVAVGIALALSLVLCVIVGFSFCYRRRLKNCWRWWWAGYSKSVVSQLEKQESDDEEEAPPASPESPQRLDPAQPESEPEAVLSAVAESGADASDSDEEEDSAAPQGQAEAASSASFRQLLSPPPQPSVLPDGLRDQSAADLAENSQMTPPSGPPEPSAADQTEKTAAPPHHSVPDEAAEVDVDRAEPPSPREESVAEQEEQAETPPSSPKAPCPSPPPSPPVAALLPLPALVLGKSAHTDQPCKSAHVEPESAEKPPPPPPPAAAASPPPPPAPPSPLLACGPPPDDPPQSVGDVHCASSPRSPREPDGGDGIPELPPSGYEVANDVQSGATSHRSTSSMQAVQEGCATTRASEADPLDQARAPLAGTPENPIEKAGGLLTATASRWSADVTKEVPESSAAPNIAESQSPPPTPLHPEGESGDQTDTVDDPRAEVRSPSPSHIVKAVQESVATPRALEPVSLPAAPYQGAEDSRGLVDEFDDLEADVASQCSGNTVEAGQESSLPPCALDSHPPTAIQARCAGEPGNAIEDFDDLGADALSQCSGNSKEIAHEASATAHVAEAQATAVTQFECAGDLGNYIVEFDDLGADAASQSSGKTLEGGGDLAAERVLEFQSLSEAGFRRVGEPDGQIDEFDGLRVDVTSQSSGNTRDALLESSPTPRRLESKPWAPAQPGTAEESGDFIADFDDLGADAASQTSSKSLEAFENSIATPCDVKAASPQLTRSSHQADNAADTENVHTSRVESPSSSTEAVRTSSAAPHAVDTRSSRAMGAKIDCEEGLARNSPDQILGVGAASELEDLGPLQVGGDAATPRHERRFGHATDAGRGGQGEVFPDVGELLSPICKEAPAISAVEPKPDPQMVSPDAQSMGPVSADGTILGVEAKFLEDTHRATLQSQQFAQPSVSSPKRHTTGPSLGKAAQDDERDDRCKRPRGGRLPPLGAIDKAGVPIGPSQTPLGAREKPTAPVGPSQAPQGAGDKTAAPVGNSQSRSPSAAGHVEAAGFAFALKGQRDEEDGFEQIFARSRPKRSDSGEPNSDASAADGKALADGGNVLLWKGHRPSSAGPSGRPSLQRSGSSSSTSFLCGDAAARNANEAEKTGPAQAKSKPAAKSFNFVSRRAAIPGAGAAMVGGQTVQSAKFPRR